MKIVSRPILIGVLILNLLASACGALARTSPLPLGTILPASQTQIPGPTSTAATLITATNTAVTPVIPITGENVVEMQCQFCVSGFTHAVFIFPDFAIFDVETTTPVTCLTAEVVNGKRVLVCHGTSLTSFNLKICSDTSNCLLFPVALQDCPLAGTTGTPVVTGTPATPVFLIPINTLRAPTRTPIDLTASPTQTSAPPLVTATTQPPLPTATPVLKSPTTYP